MEILEPRKAKAAFIEWHLRKAVERLGYRHVESVPRRADRVWCFSRAGQEFLTEMICIELRWRPRRTLEVDCFGSMESSSYLAEHGLTRKAAGFNLHQYQVAHLDRGGDEILPAAIPLGDRKDWAAVLEKLDAELAYVDSTVWQDLWEVWCVNKRMQDT